MIVVFPERLGLRLGIFTQHGVFHFEVFFKHERGVGSGQKIVVFIDLRRVRLDYVADCISTEVFSIEMSFGDQGVVDCHWIVLIVLINLIEVIAFSLIISLSGVGMSIISKVIREG